MKQKVSIIGAGHTGVTTAFLLASKNICDIVLISRNENRAKGLALDILESTPILNSDVNIIGSNKYEDCKDSNVNYYYSWNAAKKRDE